MNKIFNIKEEKTLAGLYIDFDNLWASILDLVPSIKKRKEEDDNILQEVIDKLNFVIDKILFNLKKENIEIKYISAYADFNNLPFNNDINIIDILHQKGIKTFIPYVRGNKDMSDRALIISVIEDIFFTENIDMVLVLTGDIDYLPLFEFISSKIKKDFAILSFENRLNNGYKDIFYLENKIYIIDELLNIKSIELEEDKKYNIFKEFLEEKNIDIYRGIDIEKTIKNLNSYYFYKFDEKMIKKFITKIKRE